jgi:hypothetical protein
MTDFRRTFQEIVGAVTLIAKDGRAVTWSNISQTLKASPATLRDIAGRAGISGIEELKDFVLESAMSSNVQ